MEAAVSVMAMYQTNLFDDDAAPAEVPTPTSYVPTPRKIRRIISAVVRGADGNLSIAMDRHQIKCDEAGDGLISVGCRLKLDGASQVTVFENGAVVWHWDNGDHLSVAKKGLRAMTGDDVD